jgi:hypothetical protein
MSWAWWRTTLIPALGRQRQADFWVQDQPGPQSELKDSQGYTEKPCLKKKKIRNIQIKITLNFVILVRISIVTPRREQILTTLWSNKKSIV